MRQILPCKQNELTRRDAHVFLCMSLMHDWRENQSGGAWVEEPVKSQAVNIYSRNYRRPTNVLNKPRETPDDEIQSSDQRTWPPEILSRAVERARHSLLPDWRNLDQKARSMRIQNWANQLLSEVSVNVPPINFDWSNRAQTASFHIESWTLLMNSKFTPETHEEQMDFVASAAHELFHAFQCFQIARTIAGTIVADKPGMSSDQVFRALQKKLPPDAPSVRTLPVRVLKAAAISPLTAGTQESRVWLAVLKDQANPKFGKAFMSVLHARIWTETVQEHWYTLEHPSEYKPEQVAHAEKEVSDAFDEFDRASNFTLMEEGAETVEAKILDLFEPGRSLLPPHVQHALNFRVIRDKEIAYAHRQTTKWGWITERALGWARYPDRKLVRLLKKIIGKQ